MLTRPLNRHIVRTISLQAKPVAHFSDHLRTGELRLRRNFFCEGSFGLRPARSISTMGKIAFQVENIPLTGCPVADELKVVVEPVSKLSEAAGDLFVCLLRSPAPDSQPEQSADKKTDDATKEKKLPPLPSAIQGQLRTELEALMKRFDFTGAEEKTLTVRLPSGLNFSEAGVLGVGGQGSDQSSLLHGYGSQKSAPLTSFKAGKLGKPLAAMAAALKAKSMTVFIATSEFQPEGLQSLVESFILAQSKDLRFKSKVEDAPQHVTDLRVILCFGADVPSAIPNDYLQAPPRAVQISRGVQLTRQLVDTPPNFCNPETLAKAAMEVAQECGLEQKVLGLEECVERRMGAYLAVNQGSAYEPRFIHLTYKPQGGVVKKRLALIGKGVCMDTGGYNLKIACGIETMKFDMGGAAAVFGAARIIGALKPAGVEVHFVVAAAENMVSSTAYRPGDIVTASNGKTIEVGNTDAEGRLTLADALVYAEKECAPDMIIDCATLTGACIVGLGQQLAAAYSSDDALMRLVLQSAALSGTALWPMPLFSEYKKHNESTLADLSNLPSERVGGSISAAWFLKEFVKDTPWCHIDLAGPVWNPTAKASTGYGASLLAQVALSLASQTEAE